MLLAATPIPFLASDSLSIEGASLIVTADGMLCVCNISDLMPLLEWKTPRKAGIFLLLTALSPDS